MAVTLNIAPGYEALLGENGLRSFDDFMRKPASAPATSKHWNRETVPIDLRFGGESKRFFLKRLFKMQPEHVIGALLRLRQPRPQPVNEWHNIARLEAAGIACAKRVAMGERRVYGIPREGFLLLEEVPATNTLADWLAPSPGVATVNSRGRKPTGSSPQATSAPAGAAEPSTLPASPGRDLGVNPADGVHDQAGLTPSNLSGWLKRRLVVELGALASRFDAAGICWLDPHPRHVFARLDLSGGKRRRWQFYVIDIERIRFCKPLDPKRMTVATPVAFADMLDPTTTRRWVREPGQFDFEILYGALADLVHKNRHNLPSWRAGFRGLLWHTRRISRQMQHHRRSCPVMLAKHDRPAEALPNGLWQAPEFAPLLASLGLDTFDGAMNYTRGTALTKAGLGGWRRRDRIELHDDQGRAIELFLKRYHQPPPREQWRRIVRCNARRSTAAIERSACDRLSEIGIPANRCVAFGERLHGCIERTSFLLLNGVPGQSMEAFVHDVAAGRTAPPAAILRHEMTRRLAILVRRMHDHDCFHRDLYLSHVFLELRDGEPYFHLIDLARLINDPRRHVRWRTKDLAALDYSSPPQVISRTDRMRFLRTYLRHGARPAAASTLGELMTLSVPWRIRTTRSLPVKFFAAVSGGSLRWMIQPIRARTAQMARHDAKHGRRGHLLPATEGPR